MSPLSLSLLPRFACRSSLVSLVVGIGAAAGAGHNKAGHGGPNGTAIKERWADRIKEAMGPMGLPTNTFFFVFAIWE